MIFRKSPCRIFAWISCIFLSISYVSSSENFHPVSKSGRLPWVLRGGSSENVQDNEWLKVEKVADIKTALSDHEETTVEEHALNLQRSGQVEVLTRNDEYVFMASKHGDGSEADPDGIPTRFHKMQKGNREKAKAAFAATVQWREDYQVNNILSRPYDKYDLCKAIFPVYIPGRDTAGNLVVVQRPGLTDFESAHKNNVTSDDLLIHYVYVVEYCWNILDPAHNGTMTTVLDLEGVGFETFRNKEKRKFMMDFVKMMSDNYPQRSYKTLIINAPNWINLVFKVVRPLLRESTQKKISIRNGGKAQDQLLIEVLGLESVPKDLLKNQDAVDKNDDEVNSEIEAKLRSFVSTFQNLFVSRFHISHR